MKNLKKLSREELRSLNGGIMQCSPRGCCNYVRNQQLAPPCCNSIIPLCPATYPV